MPKPPYKLTPNQKRFVEDAEEQGFKVSYDYSGRFMYGAQCPSITVDSVARFRTDASIRSDNLGLDFVVYAPD